MNGCYYMHTLADGKFIIIQGPNYRGIPSIKHSLICPSHSPHRHYTHSQQPVHCTKPCGGHGRPDKLPQYTNHCGEYQGWRAAATWMSPLLSEVFPPCLMGLGVSRRALALLGTKGCSNCSQSLYSENSRYMWVLYMCNSMYWSVGDTYM